MVRLTPELIGNAPQYTNSIKDRELDLRGYKVPLLENLGCTLDQFDTIDFTDNEIRKLDGFPFLQRLKCLIMTENKVVRISDDLGQQLPNLDTLILTGNKIAELRDLDPLSTCRKLTFLSLIQCPVTLRANYRLYAISRIASLRFLDYRRVTQSERKLARSMFKHIPVMTTQAEKNTVNGRGVTAQRPNAASGAVKTFIPGAPLQPSNATAEATDTVSAKQTVENGAPHETNKSSSEPVASQTTTITPASTAPTQPTPLPPGPILTGSKRPAGGATNQDLLAIQDAIKRARTMDEVERLHQLLSSGQFAGFAGQWQQQQRK